MRKIIRIIAGRQIDVSKDIDLSKVKINRLWTIYDEKEMWDASSTDFLDNLVLKHNHGVFLEDIVHDWNITNGKLNYYSRVIKPGTEIEILIEYELK